MSKLPRPQAESSLAQRHTVGMFSLVSHVPSPCLSCPTGLLQRSRVPGICKISGTAQLLLASLLLKSEERKAHGAGFLGRGSPTGSSWGKATLFSAKGMKPPPSSLHMPHHCNPFKYLQSQGTEPFQSRAHRSQGPPESGCRHVSWKGTFVQQGFCARQGAGGSGRARTPKGASPPLWEC